MRVGTGMVVLGALLAVAGCGGGPARSAAASCDPSTAGAGLCVLRTPGVLVPTGRSAITDIVMAATSRDDVWLLALTRGRLTHWDGHRWKRVAVPWTRAAAPGAMVAAGPRDLWIAASRTHGVGLDFEHWDGSSWTSYSDPTLTASASLVVSTKLALVAGSGPSDVWAVDRRRDLVLHWDGRSWRDTAVPYTESGCFTGDMVSDGHGGLWLALSAGVAVYQCPASDTTAGNVTTVDTDGVHGPVGGVLHRTSTGAVTEIAGARPPYGSLNDNPPVHGADKVEPPWQDVVDTALLGAIPGTAGIWFRQQHRMSVQGTETIEDYGFGSTLLIEHQG